MSINYYFRNKESLKKSQLQNQQIDKLFTQLKQDLYNIGADVDGVYYKLKEVNWMLHIEPKELHIGKRSTEWKPLFEIQNEYKSVVELFEWYSKNKDEYEIVDEYGAIYTWEQLENELINWNKDNPDARSHIDNIKKHNFSYSNRYFEIDGYEWYSGEFS